MEQKGEQTLRKNLGDRMKEYENVLRSTLTRDPAIIRIDGKAFHTYTKEFKKPFNDLLISAMQYATMKLCEEVQNVKVGYGQSDEITLLMTVHENDAKQHWFNGNVQKIVSVTSSIATYYFNEYMDRMYWTPMMFKSALDGEHYHKRAATFDSRVFNVPLEEVTNNFIWRQEDAIKNSKSSLAQEHFSHKELHKKNSDELVEMLKEKGIIWGDLSIYKQRGFSCLKEYYEVELPKNLPAGIQIPENVLRTRWKIDNEMPIVVKNKDYIENLLIVKSG